jgi:hypothetical protein
MEKAELTDSAKRLQERSLQKIQSARDLLKEKHFVTDDNKDLKGEVEKSVPALELYIRELDIQPSGEAKLKESPELRPKREFLRSIKDFSEKKAEELKREKKDDSKFDAYSKITLSQDAYSEIERLKVEKEKAGEAAAQHGNTLCRILAAAKGNAADAFLVFLHKYRRTLPVHEMGRRWSASNWFLLRRMTNWRALGSECRFLDGQTTPPQILE